MPPLSAADAIAPAWTHTRQMLFAPFRAGRSWKLAATAYLARSATIFIPFPLLYLFFLSFIPQDKRNFLALLLIALIIGVTAVVIGFFYICTRLQFVTLELVLKRGALVAPAWRRYGRQSLSWTGCKLLAGTVIMLLVAAPIASFGRRAFTTLLSVKPGEQPPPELMFAMLSGYGLLLVSFVGFYFVSALAHDVTLPFSALRGDRVRDALVSGWTVARRDLGSFAVFALLKFMLMAAGYLMAAIAVEVVLLLAVLLAGLAGLLLHALGVPTPVLIVLAIVIGAGLYLGAVFYLGLLAIGAVSIFIEAHALYFLAGRIPEVGDLLVRSAPAAWPPPIPPPRPAATPPPHPGV